MEVNGRVMLNNSNHDLDSAYGLTMPIVLNLLLPDQVWPPGFSVQSASTRTRPFLASVRLFPKEKTLT